MKTITEEDFASNLFTLLKETFEGPPPNTGSVYLDQSAGLFQTLESVTAEEASRPVQPGIMTIAAHCEHIRFYLAVLDRYMHGAAERVDWNQSWLVHAVTPSEWESLKDELHQAYATVTQTLQSVGNWEDASVGGGMAIITHTAYHLGAIRQLLRMLR